MSELVWSVGDKRLILTVTAGRSGTGYLWNLFRDLPWLFCGHEPEPRFDYVMRDAQSDQRLATTFLLEEKLPAIRGMDQPIYFETSHVACKGFIEPLVDNGVVPDLVLLHRDPVLIATSLYRLNTIPGRTATGLSWYLSPFDPTVRGLGHCDDLHDWALCFWYCREIERRMRVYAELVERHGGRTFQTSIDELRQDQGLADMVRFFGIDWEAYIAMPDLGERRQAVINTKAERKEFHGREVPKPAMIEALCAEVDHRMMGADAQ